MEGELLDLLSPAWRIMLLSDGSVTRHLRLLCPKLDCTALELVAPGPIGPGLARRHQCRAPAPPTVQPAGRQPA